MGATTLKFVFAAASFAALGCVNNPVHDDEVASLGPEVPGVPAGPLHRAGQPCLVCHGPFGPSPVQFSFGGTVYATAGQEAPAVNAVVQVHDVTGASISADTNAAGNFYVLLRDFEPTYPISPEVSSSDGSVVQKMMTYVARNGSCAGCHGSAPSATSAGPVVLVTDADAGKEE